MSEHPDWWIYVGCMLCPGRGFHGFLIGLVLKFAISSDARKNAEAVNSTILSYFLLVSSVLTKVLSHSKSGSA